MFNAGKSMWPRQIDVAKANTLLIKVSESQLPVVDIQPKINR